MDFADPLYAAMVSDLLLKDVTMAICSCAMVVAARVMWKAVGFAQVTLPTLPMFVSRFVQPECMLDIWMAPLLVCVHWL